MVPVSNRDLACKASGQARCMISFNTCMPATLGPTVWQQSKLGCEERAVQLGELPLEPQSAAPRLPDLAFLGTEGRGQGDKMRQVIATEPRACVYSRRSDVLVRNTPPTHGSKL